MLRCMSVYFVILVTTFGGIAPTQSLAPEQWFPGTKLVNKHYSNFLFSYIVETSLSFEEIQQVIKTEIGDSWVLDKEDRQHTERTRTILKEQEMALLGISQFSRSDATYGAVSVMLTKSTSSQDSQKTLLININDPSASPENIHH